MSKLGGTSCAALTQSESTVLQKAEPYASVRRIGYCGNEESLGLKTLF